MKGQETLIAAGGTLRKAGADFHILLAGETVDSSYERVCRQKAAELDISDRVTFMGHQDDMASCLLYTSDAADDLLCVDLGGRRIIKKKTQKKHNYNSRHRTPQ